jgi:hypothetical protein
MTQGKRHFLSKSCDDDRISFAHLTQIKQQRGKSMYSGCMLVLLRLFAYTILTVALGVYGVQAQAAMPPGAMTMVICATDGPTAIIVDATGKPITPGQGCCDCTSCTATPDTLAPARYLLRATPLRAVMVLLPARNASRHRTKSTRPQARGPPNAKQVQVDCTLPLRGDTTFKETAA